MSFALSHEIISIEARTKSISATEWPQRVEAMMKDMLDALGMLPLGPLLQCTSRQQNATIRSFIQPITTSHIAGHYYVSEDFEPEFHFDVYTCDGISIETTLQVLHSYIPLIEWSGTYIRRNIDDTRYIVSLSGNGANCVEKEILRQEAQPVAA